ncbi:MAG: hypothetical protein HQL95_12025, partial [Magnetococcales bacterium]|nr:hypothetical protein [Magnetococcales bacterium]
LLFLARFSKGNCEAIPLRARQAAKRRLFSFGKGPAPFFATGEERRRPKAARKIFSRDA